MLYKKSVFRSLAMVTQLGLCVMTPIFLCVFAGYQIDSHFGTKLMVLLLILGILAGGRNAWMMVHRVLKQEEQDDARELANKPVIVQKERVRRPKQQSRILKSAPVEKKEREDDGLAK